jgi:hypothetical protein
MKISYTVSLGACGPVKKGGSQVTSITPFLREKAVLIPLNPGSKALGAWLGEVLGALGTVGLEVIAGASVGTALEEGASVDAG